MNDTDKMVAHMIHKQQEAASLRINEILIRFADRLSPEFLSEATAENGAWLGYIQGIDSDLMDKHLEIATIGGKGLVLDFIEKDKDNSNA